MTDNPYQPPSASLTPAQPELVTELSFSLTQRDFILYNQAHINQTGSRIRRIILGVLGVIFLSGAATNFARGDIAWWSMAALLIGACLAYYGFWYGSGPYFARMLKRAEKEGRRLGEAGDWTIAISPETLSYTSPTTRCEQQWRAVERITASKDIVMFYTTSVTAIIVPKIAFASDGEAEAFVKAAGDWFAADRKERGEDLPTPPKRSAPYKTILLWIVLILVFLAIYNIMSPAGP